MNTAHGSAIHSEGAARIAVLVPSTFLLDGEICEMAARRGAEAHLFRVHPESVADPRDSDAVARMVEDMGSVESLSKAAAQTADVAPHAIVWACTSGSFLGDGNYGERQARALSKSAGNVPATTTSLALVAALKRVRARKLLVLTPYHAEIGIEFVNFLEKNGFDAVGQAHAGKGSDGEVGALRLRDFLALAQSAGTSPRDAIVIPCTAVRDRRMSAELSRELRLPVIAANAATMDLAVQLAREEHAA
ncbi:MAG: hypothetical protein F4Y72_11630 [Gammaproteobacteria bacterium]|nr:hypothetical protein [Gammaproteobacteria bacterium]